MKKLPGKFSMFWRSLLFSIIVPPWTIFYGICCLISKIFPLRYRYKFILGWTASMVWLLKVLCKIDYHVEGLENIPHDRSGVVLCKHQSAWETFLIPRYFNLTAIILKQELTWIPFFGWGLAATDPIAINRSDRRSAMAQVMEKGKKCLEEGRWILIFPEGTRIPAGQVGKYRLGGPRLAVAAEVPVIPVAHNAGYFWPKRKFLKVPGTVQVRIGPLIESKGRTPEEVLALTKTWIEDTIQQLPTK